MAKRGRRSIRNKRKSVKKYSSKRRSKTRRYLRGGEGHDDDDLKDPAIIAGFKRAADNYAANPDTKMTHADISLQNCIKDCPDGDWDVLDDCKDDCFRKNPSAKLMGGGRRRYYKRKQSKTRKH